ncbi:hypothetical protein [Stenotrophomonas maltophilia]|uniref:hypothetical protein n=1 Tax=Stenotrophomonas maltophilia TaxID=40324 RepID=UPI0007F8A979|nr:hypothetical protein [Stenotrophomonas maltophilia]OBU59223.1 hypothetical protein A9K70_01485 [Stenotrophomonas maltophilia]
MGPSTESLALADFLISKLGLQVDRISLAYAIMDHVEVEYADELAQPSPGGQDGLNYERMFVDACAALAEVSRELGCDPEQGGAEPILAAIAELREALAARQPVGEPFGYCADFDPGAHEFSHTFYYLAPGETVPAGCTAFYAAPPAQAVCSNCKGVGVIPYTFGQTPEQFEQGEYPCPECTPAQAVDLGQFREAVTEWRSNWANYGRTMTSAGRDTSKARRNVDEADRLLALIDSQVVGNG